MKRKATKTIGCYVRISTADGKQKLDSQEAEIKRWLRANGYNSDHYRWYRDKVSGTTNERPALQQMLRHVARGSIKVVVCFKLDRLARNLQAGLSVLEQFAKHDVRVVAVAGFEDVMGRPVPIDAALNRLAFRHRAESPLAFSVNATPQT